MTAVAKVRALRAVILLGFAALLVSALGDGMWSNVMFMLAVLIWTFRGRLRALFRPRVEVHPLLLELSAEDALRTLKRRFAIIIPLFLVARVGSEVWARHSLAVYEQRVRAEIAVERQRLAAVRIPVLRGEPIDADAAPKLEALLTRLASVGAPTVDALRRAAHDFPSRPLSKEVQAIVTAHEADLAELRAAFQCTRCAWPIDYEPELGGTSDLVSMGVMADLLILEGDEYLAEGRVAPAAERYLDGVRLAALFGLRDLPGCLTALGCEYRALDALGTLTTRIPRQNVLELATARAEIEMLASSRPRLEHAFRQHRLSGLMFVRAVNKTVFGSELTFGGVMFPERALHAHMLPEREGFLRELEASAGIESRVERESVEAAIDARARASLNPMTFTIIHDLTHASSFAATSLAKFRLVTAALGLELDHRGGPYPASLELPRDPLAENAPLGYTSDGAKYKLSCVDPRVVLERTR